MNKRFLVFLSSRKSWTLPYIIFSAIFVIIPLVLIVVYAFTDDNGHLTFANFQKFFEHPEAINTFVYSIGIAIITTLICILLGYPAAWILSNSKLNRSRTMVVLFILPMWVNILVRTLATVALFDFFSVPLGEGALIFGMVYNFIPFMIYPIYNTLQKMDHSYIEAAHLRGKNSYACQDYTKGTAFLIGNEGNGLREETAELADCYIRIPMEGKVESLNAAVASSILMYEAHRQRAI